MTRLSYLVGGTEFFSYEKAKAFSEMFFNLPIVKRYTPLNENCVDPLKNEIEYRNSVCDFEKKFDLNLE